MFKQIGSFTAPYSCSNLSVSFMDLLHGLVHIVCCEENCERLLLSVQRRVGTFPGVLKVITSPRLPEHHIYERNKVHSVQVREKSR